MDLAKYNKKKSVLSFKSSPEADLLLWVAHSADRHGHDKKNPKH